MRISRTLSQAVALCAVVSVATPAVYAQGQARPATGGTVPPKLDAYKKEALAEVDNMATFTQQMVDQIFSYGELGFQEVETTKYVTDILRKNGFTVPRH